MGWARQAWVGLLGQVSWRWRDGPQRMLTSFSQAERGSFYDMLAAAERTERRELRRRYIEHALDESRHAGLFLQRVRDLGSSDRTQAVLADSAYLADKGIVGEQTLFDRLGERRFLALVHVGEADAVEQFDTYLRMGLPDPETDKMLRTILRDEAFHVSYTRAALEPYIAAGQGDQVRWDLHWVRWHRAWEGWKRFSHRIGAFMSTLWLGLLYLVVVGPFSLFERRAPGGWVGVKADPRDTKRAARSQA